MKKFLSVFFAVILFGASLVFADDRPRKQYQYSVTVTSSSTEIIPENSKGRDIFIQNNDSSAIVYLNFSGAATVSDTMIKLEPDDSVSISSTTNAVYAIGSTASNANVAVSEGK